ncbi:cation diffusion facilitator family transporter [Halomarina oriensis]|uniref:Cation diffusion facilitator family transporter n=1 Tax=Halomarina oriensis TaxID=671145 RepID=A0A6B0GR13_9EURY|nr:cation diffusion facilitator family transporter [Halomarina oriensis]MWG35103.1 cation diffusion facilitator family transporter [Halomarina oriensis]
MDRVTALRRVGVLVLGVNLLLALAKGAVYLSTDSLAVGGEAINSLADTAYSLVIVAGLYLTTQPADDGHPHGHERIEPFVSLVVAIGIAVAGVGVLWQAVQSVLAGGTAVAGPLAAGVLAASAVVKYLLYRYCARMADTHRSPALRATALDNRADILTASAALVGVLGAALGYPVFDPLAGGVVALGILYTGYEIGRDNVGYLVGRAPDEELHEDIIERALTHPDVHGVHDVVAHHVGPEVDVSLHLEIEGDLTLGEAHDIETAVVREIRAVDAVDDVFVHLDPRELGEWKEEDGERITAEDTPPARRLGSDRQ